MKDFEWVSFYKEFANVLLAYKNNRKELVEKIKKIYSNTGIDMPTLDRPDLIDIDPFTTFGLFNKSSQKTTNRIKILEQIKQLFDIKEPVPNSFGSIPVLNNQNATYYDFQDTRADNDIDDLWDLFTNALKYTNDQSLNNKNDLSKSFDTIINKRGNGNSKVTMGLYWIAPEIFLNLDSRNEWFIYESGRLPKDLVESLPEIEPKIASEKYFSIIDKITEYLHTEKSEFKDFKELSYEAWRYSSEINEQNRLKKQEEQKASGFGDEDVSETHYWSYSPGTNANKWEEYSNSGLMGIGWSDLGDLLSYGSRTEIQNKMKELYGADKSYTNDSLAVWQFVKDLKPGDIVFAKKGLHRIVGRGIVDSAYYYDDNAVDFKHLRKIKWTHIGEWDVDDQFAQKTLTDITSFTTFINKLESLFVDSEGNIPSEEIKHSKYTKSDFLNEVFINEKQYDTLTNLIRKKMNVILQGAPGVGKTYAAKRLAYSIIGEMNKDRVMMIQFHQSYSYEDFIEGYRPSSDNNGFEIKKGSFYNFCKKAENDKDHDYFFIIDEINRGNLSKIFGELFMLIENDKRDYSLQLLYSDEKFSVPSNVYIIGLMNTADRSLALLDYALRRRFSFYEMKPAFDQTKFIEYVNGMNDPMFNKLIECVKSLNEKIKNDSSLGEGFCIGHSYFCELENTNDDTLSNIVEYELIPLIKEYWFDELDLVKHWSDSLRNSIK